MIHHYPPYNKTFGKGSREFSALISQKNFTYQFRIKADNIGMAELYVTGPNFVSDLQAWNQKVADEILFCAVKLSFIEGKYKPAKKKMSLSLLLTFFQMFGTVTPFNGTNTSTSSL